MELLNQAQILPNQKHYNYRIKTCVNFLRKGNLIESYTDKITDDYLLNKINNILNILKINDLKIPYAYFQKSNYSDEYGILFSLNSYDNRTALFFDNILNDNNLRVVCYNIITISKKSEYYSQEQKLPYKYYDFIWYVSIDSFIQVNPETSDQIHKTVDSLILKDKDKKYNYYGLGGEMGVYAKKIKDHCNQIKCITNSEAIYSDYQVNIGDKNCVLVDYDTIKLVDIFTDVENSILLVNISRNGLRGLARQIKTMNFKQIIYIGCCDEAVNRDISELKQGYEINKIVKINQFPETLYYSYVIEFIMKMH